MKYNSIGIIGGFGAFATLDFFGRLLVRFRSDCERNYPRIVMDNNFRMPSRTSRTVRRICLGRFPGVCSWELPAFGRCSMEISCQKKVNIGASRL